ncbi:MAG: hypothetical protein KTR20_03965 [Cellvibrionaceae bacterium]|nr:hypothetical protein [Cellvibrionaceae bacterium]
MSQEEYVDQFFYVASLIENYLRSHPEAMDNFEGISKWWITKQKMHESAHSVNNALNILIERGVVEKIGDEYYQYVKSRH